jgi:hypothetical protein
MDRAWRFTVYATISAAGMERRTIGAKLYESGITDTGSSSCDGVYRLYKLSGIHFDCNPQSCGNTDSYTHI